ncbi:MAG: glycoside hydrolase family 88 protein, partial [Chitinispirillaceae bacterium]|nr:glycoside hydrolase family 88 protein [Chitinispirillaceae bacterium]
MNNRGLSRLLVLSIATAVVLPPSGNEASPPLPSKAQIIAKMKLANDRFMAKWPDPCSNCLTGNRPSNIWTRAVYYEGALAYARLAGDSAVWNHAVKWGTFHKWNFRNGTTTTNADDQCAGQCYIELYQFDRKPERITNTRSCMDNMVKNKSNTFWTWIDAIQMAMPVFAKLGVIDESAAYFDKMDALFDFTASTLGLYNTNDRLWWRDTTFKKAKTPAGKNIYWSRGNGWVFAALARVLDVIPATDPRCEKYTAFFIDMAAALKAVQRSDGFWNESLADPAHFGGPEVTGT